MKTCDWAGTQSPRAFLGDRREAGRVSDWQRVCRLARSLKTGDPASVRRFFETQFQPLSGAAGKEGRLSAYHTPALKGSWTRTSRFSTPIYAKPDTGGRMPSRKEIAAGALTGRGLELLWVDDPIAAYFMEVEGAGRVLMPDGSSVGLDFDGQNGHSYRDIGEAVAASGLKRDSRSLLSWMRANPARAREAMNLNPSKVFFRLHKGETRGSIGIELTPGRSVAIDPRHLPLGPLVWLEMNDLPVPVPGGGRRRLVAAQDTGGDIKGAERGDLFVGQGPAAAHAADRLATTARMTVLVPRTSPVQVAQTR